MKILGQQFQKAAEIRFVEFFERRKLPQQRPEAITELDHPGIQEPLDRFTGFLQLAAMGDVARSLDREDEAVWDLRRPLAKGRRRLCAIESAVDLDRGEMARRIAELLRMRQAIGIEHAPPWRKGPTADADVDMSDDLFGLGHGI